VRLLFFCLVVCLPVSHITMCGSACVYIMLPQQRKYEKVTTTTTITKDKESI